MNVWYKFHIYFQYLRKYMLNMLKFENSLWISDHIKKFAWAFCMLKAISRDIVFLFAQVFIALSVIVVSQEGSTKKIYGSDFQIYAPMP